MGKFFEKLSRGKKRSQVYKFPSVQDTFKKMWMDSRYPVRVLGVGDSWVYLADEYRTNMHIIGTTRVGKSSFLEHLIRGDLDAGHGGCFIDSTEGGKTVYNILRYCAENNRAKVLFIDPLHVDIFKKITPINVFGATPEESAQKVWDIIQIQFLQKDSSETPVIKQYLPAIVKVLHKAGVPLLEVRAFSNSLYVSQREQIYAKLPKADPDVQMLQAAFSKPDMYREFRPTGRRILDILHPTLSLYFGAESDKCLDFTRLVADNWYILVNLYPQKQFGDSAARFLGTAIINEIIRAIDALTGNELSDHPWSGKHYLYIDEVGRYANRKIQDIFDYKSKTGLILTVAHQNLGQIEDTKVRDAVLNQTSTKVVFRMESEDATRLARLIYGGSIPDAEAAHYIRRLKKQECIVKLPAENAEMVVVPKVERNFTVDLKTYLHQLYNQDCYIPTKDIQQPDNTIYYQTETTNESTNRTVKAHKASQKATKRNAGKNTAPRSKVDNAAEPDFSFRSLREDEITHYKNDKE